MEDVVIVASDGIGVRYTYRAADRMSKLPRVKSRLRRLFLLREKPEQEVACVGYLDELAEGTAIFFSHGDHSNIFGATYRYNNQHLHRTLINHPNTHKSLKGLSVIAVCCASSTNLGRKSVEEEVVPVYLGFDQDIEWDRVDQAKFKTFLATVLVDTIADAIESRKTFEELKRDLEVNLERGLKKVFGREVLKHRAIELVGKIISAITCHGNAQLKV